jgi:hypothetical protein
VSGAPSETADARHEGPPRDGRRIVVAATLAYFGVLYVLARAGVELPWRFLGVPQIIPTFADLHNVTSAAECAARGADPLLANPCDAHGRPMNYPRVWLLLVGRGMDGDLRTILGTCMAVSLVLTVLAFCGRLTRREGALASALLLSPAVMLLVERGNVDGWVFVLCTAATWLIADPRHARKDAGAVLLALGAVLKLYPAVALGAIALPRLRGGRDLTRLAVGLVAVGAYAWWIWPDVLTIARTVPQGGHDSYGANVASLRVFGAGHPDLRLWFVAAAVGAMVSGGLLVRRRLPMPRPCEGRAGAGFLVGASVYVGTFAVGANWAYRLVFLLLLVPQLFAWGRGDRGERVTSRLIQVLVFACVWGLVAPYETRFRAPGLMDAVSAVGDAASWSLALVLAAIAGAAAMRGLSTPRSREAGSAPRALHR